MSKQARGATKVYYDTLRQGTCDTAYRTLRLHRENPKIVTFTKETYATNEYVFEYGTFSKTWNMSDSSHLVGTTKTYTLLPTDCDTLIYQVTLNRKSAAFSVASNRKVGLAPGNMNSSSKFERTTLTRGTKLGISPSYGNVAIKEGNSTNSYTANYWRMLTSDEWLYLVNTRSVSHARYTPASINGIAGFIIYPDNYTPAAAGVSTVSSKATVTAANWQKMQLQGCVFLPCNTWNSAAPGYFAADQTEAFYQGSTYQYSSNGASYIGVKIYYTEATPRWTLTAMRTGYAVVRLVHNL